MLFLITFFPSSLKLSENDYIILISIVRHLLKEKLIIFHKIVVFLFIRYQLSEKSTTIDEDGG